MQGNLTVLDSQFCTMDTAFCGVYITAKFAINLHYSGIPDSNNYKWDPEYLTFIPDSKRKISQIPDSLTWGDSDPKINTFSVKLKPSN